MAMYFEQQLHLSGGNKIKIENMFSNDKTIYVSLKKLVRSLGCVVQMISYWFVNSCLYIVPYYLSYVFYYCLVSGLFLSELSNSDS